MAGWLPKDLPPPMRAASASQGMVVTAAVKVRKRRAKRTRIFMWYDSCRETGGAEMTWPGQRRAVRRENVRELSRTLKILL